jgi:hypothetical protein
MRLGWRLETASGFARARRARRPACHGPVVRAATITSDVSISNGQMYAFTVEQHGNVGQLSVMVIYPSFRCT